MNNLAVIIPYHSTPAELESSLLSLLENRPENCEICVVLNQPYENIYELSDDEVHFLNVPKEMSAENNAILACMRLGLAACDSTYVYMMPAGVQFQSEWLGALEFLDQNEELKAFFLDADLTQGGFFRKAFLESFLQSSEISDLIADTDTECFTNLVTLMQDAELPCGLLEIEITDENTEDEPDLENPSLERETEPETEIPLKPELPQKPFVRSKTGLWTHFCELIRRFFKS